MALYFFKISFLLSLSSVWGKQYLPPSWTSLCNVTLTTSEPGSSSVANATVVTATCIVRPSNDVAWRLNDLRNWTLTEKINFNSLAGHRQVIYKLRVSCEAGANISLPWPMKLPGLQELNVTSCVLVDRYLNYPAGADLPDEMRILDIRDSQWIVGDTNAILAQSMNSTSINISSAYDCGHDDTLEIYVIRNVSDIFETNVTLTSLSIINGAAVSVTSTPINKLQEFINQLPSELGDDISSSGTVKPETRLIKDAEKVVSDQINLNSDAAKPKQSPSLATLISQQISKTAKNESTTLGPRIAEEEFLDLLRKVFNTKLQCNFVKLRHLDQSVAHFTPVTVFEFLVQGALYPTLELMNYSTIGITQFPRELSEWRRFFPKLTYIDLSNNSISQVQLKDFPSKKDTGVVTFNIQRNNITTINMEILNSWAAIEKVIVDIRQNPIHCGCEMGVFLPYLHSQTTFTGRLTPYLYVKYMECATPASLKGRQLYSLVQSALPCPLYEDHQAALIALGITLSFLLVVVIVLVRYKVEIRILLYTRFHVRVPCDSDEQRHNKTYDAFISYSNDDDSWVLENLVQFLENSPVPSSQQQQQTNGGLDQNKNPEPKSRPTNGRKRQFKLCIHQRDFVPGKTIFDNIVDSIEASRHTIIVLSPSFMKSHWAMEELRQAYRQSLVEKTRHLVVLLLQKF
ncbi:Toll-like receptor 2 type-1 [Bulinus truncatus]|nr:Toll-like receptor 2 type-1 [Bulinus truncatus]